MYVICTITILNTNMKFKYQKNKALFNVNGAELSNKGITTLFGMDFQLYIHRLNFTEHDGI